MVSTLIVNSNVYASRTTADSYLADSVSANENWDDLDNEEKDRALITATRLLEKQCWKGTTSGLTTIATMTVSAGGTGYAVGDVLTISGGTGDIEATATVATISGSEVVTVTVTNAGLYTTAPTSPASTSTTGGGSGCTLTLTTQTQELYFPATGLTDQQGVGRDDGTVPQEIIDGTIELAYLISQDSNLESSENTGSNVKSVGAGSANVEFFRPGNVLGTSGITRFPASVQELVGQFLKSSGAGVRGVVTGTEDDSIFDGTDPYTLNQGFS